MGLLPRRLTMREKLLAGAAFVAAKFYVVPHFFPTFTPSEGTSATLAEFAGQMLFFDSFHKSLDEGLRQGSAKSGMSER